MNFKIALAVVSVLVAPASLAQNAQQILEGARLAATMAETELTGKIDNRIPIALFIRPENIQFQFDEGNGQETFHMRLKDRSYELLEMNGGRQQKFPDEKITRSIAGTNLTYEDLALRFFYWPNPTLEGTEKLKGNMTYKLRLDRPKGTPGLYDTVYVWVDVKRGMFWQVKGYNKGRLLKSFSVEDLMNLGNGKWTLRVIQVAAHEGAMGQERVSSVSNLIFDQPKKAAPKGLKK